jgi:4-amino-4-deoxy-L-arabinose transferase-like glycosyltransferase
MKPETIILILALLISAWLRLWQLGQIPPALNWDEAAIGWNAKTLFFTRRDEYGTQLPLAFRSFGDFKSPLYFYLTAPIVGIFGLSQITVRLLSAVSGVVSVGLIALIAAELLGGKKGIPERKRARMGALAALVMAITPWPVLLSRPALEANLALTLILGGVWFFLKGLQRSVWLVLSAISFSLSLYAYHSPKIFVPIFVIGLAAIFRRKLLGQRGKGWIAGAALLGLVLIAPLVRLSFFGEGARRFEGTTIFYDATGQPKPFSGELIGQLVQNYLVHYSPTFLFTGVQEEYRVGLKGQGILLWAQIPFLLLGLAALWRKKDQLWARGLLFWLLIGPLPAIIGFEIPHSIRSATLMPALVLVIALGVEASWDRILKLGKGSILALAFGVLVNYLFFLGNYWKEYPVYAAADWQYGYEQAARLASQYEGQVQQIIMTSHYGQPHIFVLVYQDREPLSVFWGAMSKYLYRDLNWDEDQHRENVLLIGSPEEIPGNAPGLVEEIRFPDGQVAFRVVKT